MPTLPNNVAITEPTPEDIHSSTAVAAIDIKKGDAVEQFTYILLPWRIRDRDPRVGFLHQTAFTTKCGCMECSVYGTAFMTTSGYPRLYKHSKEPNTQILFPNIKDEDLEKNPSPPPPIGLALALKDIVKGEEITVDYKTVYSPAHPINMENLPDSPVVKEEVSL